MSLLQVMRGKAHQSPVATRSRFLARTIRGQILCAFLVMTIITGLLGLYAAYNIFNAGQLVSKTFDKSLMAVNYTRAASADFDTIQAAFARQLLSNDPTSRAMLEAKIKELEIVLSEDLAVAAERAQSERASKASARVQRAVEAWSKTRAKLVDGTNPNDAWKRLDRFAAIVEQQIDLLINYTTGDGFSYRQNAQDTVALDIRVNLLATLLAVALSGMIAWFLARSILGPIEEASEVAKSIAGGELDVSVPRRRGDELGALLAAMEVMRESIRVNLQSEVSQRRSAQTRLADALESSREGVIVLDAGARIVLVNAQASQFLEGIFDHLQVGHSARDLTKRFCANFAAPDVRSVDVPGAREARLPDGRWLRVSQNATREGGVIIVFTDITVLKDQEHALTDTNHRFDVALANMSQGLCLYDAEGRLLVFNRRFCEMFRLPSEGMDVGMSLDDVARLHVAAGNFRGTIEDCVSEITTRVSRREPTATILDLSGDRVVALAHQPLPGGGWIETYEDVTERLQSEAKIVYMARHDTLTDLPNRLAFSERAEHALASSARGDTFAVLILDLDSLQSINDTLGHSVGDTLIRLVAERLSACIREVDSLARLGGDEFAIIQCGLRDPDDAVVLARRITEAMKGIFDADGHRVTIGLSIGISLAPSDGTSLATLLKNAGVALHRAKADGRGTWRFFEAAMDARLQARRALEVDFRKALADNLFELYYQPLFDVKLNRICGFEALLRWKDPKRGMISPADFIPLAEELGLITELGGWVMHEACREARKWPEDMRVAVNVSPAQFLTGQLGIVVADALAQSGLAPSRLELEITESVILDRTGSTVALLEDMRRLGVKISMDDFGTGYSSLSYLRSFPFDKVKIDQSFTRDLGSKTDTSLIVRAIIALCKNLGMRVTAEGVETQDQLDFLATEGCDEVQGYFFSSPVPAKNVRGVTATWAGGAETVQDRAVRPLAS